MVLLQLLFPYLPLMHTAFGSQPIGLREWGLIIGASLVVYSVIEFEQWMRRGRGLEGAQHKVA